MDIKITKQLTMNYELTAETKQIGDVTLYRIRCVKSFAYANHGDLGGWIEKKDNLFGDAWVYGDAWVFGDAQVSGDAWETSPLQIQGSKHFACVSKRGYMKIGCIEKTISEWLAEFEQIGAESGYTKQQIAEYGMYIQIANIHFNI